MRREEHGQQFVPAVGFDQRLDGNLRLELRRAAGDGQHQIAMVGSEQCIQHAAVNFLFGAGQRQVGDARWADGDVFLRQRGDQRSGRPDDIDAVGADAIDHAGRTAAGGGHHRDAVALARFAAFDQRRQFEQRFQRIDAQDAVRLEKSIHGFRGAGHRAGVRGGEILTDF